MNPDDHLLRIMDALVVMLTDDAMDTEDTLEVLVSAQAFIAEQISNARREASPG